MDAKEKLLPWHITRSELLLDRSPWMRIFSDDVQLPDGTIVDGYLRLESRGYVMVVPIDDERRIGLVRSYKKGVGAIDIQPPAGVLEPDEDVLTSAKRELREELGCEAASPGIRLEHIPSAATMAPARYTSTSLWARTRLPNLIRVTWRNRK